MIQKSHFWVISKAEENRISKRYMQPHVHCSIIHSNPDMATTFRSLFLWVWLGFEFLSVVQIPHKWYHAVLSFCVWFISYTIIPSRFIHVVPKARCFFLTLNNILYHFSVDRNIWLLPCCHIWVTVNNAAVDMGLHISLWYPVFLCFGYYPEVGFLDHMVVLFLNFWGTSNTVFHSGYTNLTFLPTVYKGSLFSTSLPTFIFLMTAIPTGVKW